jgi:RNA polymerase sigma factor (sigma-70 family)
MAGVAGPESDDGELVDAARRGEQSAWDELVHRHGGRVWAVARAHRLSRADSEDVFQVTFLRLVTHLDTIREPGRVGAWLATTARHECLRIFRYTGRVVPTCDDDDLDPPSHTARPVESGLLAAERDEALMAALGRLSDHCQRLLRMLMAEPVPTYEQVSLTLDIPIGSIGPQRGRCLKYLRRELGGINDADGGSQPT